MPPTIQSGSREDRDRKRGGEKRSDLVARVKYNNTLPDIPFDPKFITYPFESNRFIEYKATSLERAYKYELLTEHDLGVTIDLINPDTYQIDPNAYPDPEDERLLEEDHSSHSDSKRSRHHNMNVSWLRKTEYISTEYNRFTQKTGDSERRVGFKIKQIMKDEDVYKDRESQIAAIEKTFKGAKEPITKHYSKPGVKPLDILPIFPDFDLWKHPFAQVIFDSDPAPKGRFAPNAMEEMSQAMIRGAVDESGEQFVAYFLPNDETLGKRKRDAEENVDYVPDEEYQYMLSREYNWNVKNKLSRGYEETYFFVFRDDGVYYNELETRVRLSKRRKAGGAEVPKSRLVVKHRDLNTKEIQAQDTRLMMLEPPQEEEEEEEQFGSEAEGSVKSGGSKRSRKEDATKPKKLEPKDYRKRLIPRTTKILDVKTEEKISVKEENISEIPAPLAVHAGENGIDNGVSSYEQLRLKNLQDNADFFAKLGITEMKTDIKQSLKPSKTTQLKSKPVKKEKTKAPPETRRASLRIAKMDPDGAPLPEDFFKQPFEPVEEHPRKPSGTLEMAEYLGFNSSDSEHDDLLSKMKGCFKCKIEKSTEDKTSFDSYVKNLSKLKINMEKWQRKFGFRIYTKQSILILDIHPTNSKLLTAAGDKWGFLGIWDTAGREFQTDGVVVYAPHSRPINCLKFSLHKPNQLYSCSYDGTVRCCDLQKGVFEEIYSTPDEVLLKSFDFMTADTLLVAQQDGCIALVDTRTSRSTAENLYQLHQKSLRSVSVHPVQDNIFCTSSTDTTVCIWDLRKLKEKGKSQSLDELSHDKSINSAYFSPVTGKYILSTSLDDRIRIFNSENLSSCNKEHSIVHDNHTGRWLTGFRANWHPTREDLFTVGSMSRPRQIDVYGVNGRKVLAMKDEEYLGSVCSLTVLGRNQDVMVGANSSGKLHVFK
ncbi:PAF1 [Mytilus edulis]|uniref:RNA polymerase II-associated factor 1 homolog n=1 Tax=Mytilus edulis TaxID=6550 RepID=A0A8S3S5R5_MYTED|nr:PAF1 [Mytilus edulis]